MRTRIRGQSYEHPFAKQDLAQPLSDEEKKVALKARDWDLLIESHMRLGCAIAGRYVRLGGNSDEMVSSAMLGIVEAVDRFKRGTVLHDNITGYIIHYIHQSCIKALRLDCVIPVPQNNDTKITVLSTDRNPSETVWGAEGGIIICPITDNNIEVTATNMGELYETVEYITHTELERNVVFLRQQGYTDADVADNLGIGRSTVTKIRKRLLERFNNV